MRVFKSKLLLIVARCSTRPRYTSKAQTYCLLLLQNLILLLRILIAAPAAAAGRAAQDRLGEKELLVLMRRGRRRQQQVNRHRRAAARMMRLVVTVATADHADGRRRGARRAKHGAVRTVGQEPAASTAAGARVHRALLKWFR